jgi:hypothetical protein
MEEVGDIECPALPGKFGVRNLKFKLRYERGRLNHFFSESHGKILSGDLPRQLFG